jgi:prephenate dehydratase
MTRIESRPSATKNTFRFFVDIQGNLNDENIKNVLKAASSECEYFEILGCFNETK